MLKTMAKSCWQEFKKDKLSKITGGAIGGIIFGWIISGIGGAIAGGILGIIIGGFYNC